GIVDLPYFFDDVFPLLASGAEDERRPRLAGTRPVGGDRHHPHLVDLPQLAGRADRRAGHAGDVLVAGEQLLHGDLGGMPGIDGDVKPFLGLDGLMDAGAPLAALTEAAGEFIDDHDLAVADDVLAVTMEV